MNDNVDTTMIAKCFEITQQLSKDHQGHNFRCPCCTVNRIAKAKVNENEWNHTGCNCTLKWLEQNHLLSI